MDSDDLVALRLQLQQTTDELNALRSEICGRLRLSAWMLGANGEAITMPTDKMILSEITRLQVTVATYEAPSGEADHPWGTIDSMIFEGRKLQAIQSIRAQFGGSLHEALDRLVARFDKLRRERAESFTVAVDTYWDGFYS